MASAAIKKKFHSKNLKPNLTLILPDFSIRNLSDSSPVPGLQSLYLTFYIIVDLIYNILYNNLCALWLSMLSLVRNKPNVLAWRLNVSLVVELKPFNESIMVRTRPTPTWMNFVKNAVTWPMGASTIKPNTDKN